MIFEISAPELIKIAKYVTKNQTKMPVGVTMSAPVHQTKRGMVV